MVYTSLEQVKIDFKITYDEPEKIKDELNNKIRKLHPDNFPESNGHFPTKEIEDEYLNVQSAIDFIEDYSLQKNTRISNNLLTLQQNTSQYNGLVSYDLALGLIKANQEVIIKENKHKEMETRLSNGIEKSIKSYKSKTFIPKVSFTVFTGLLTFIIALPNYFKDNIFFEYFYNYYLNNNILMSYIIIFWIVFLCYTFLVWIILYYNELRKQDFLATLRLETVQNKFMINFQSEMPIDSQFTKDNFIAYVENNPRTPKPLMKIPFISNKMIDIEVAQNLADIIFDRAESKGLIKKIPEGILNDYYEFVWPDSELMKKIRASERNK